jgi:hypothetical protein
MALRSQIHVDDQARASAAARLGEMRAEWARRLADEEGLAADEAHAAAELCLAQLVGLVSDHLTDPHTPTGPAARLLAELLRAHVRHEEPTAP